VFLWPSDRKGNLSVDLERILGKDFSSLSAMRLPRLHCCSSAGVGASGGEEHMLVAHLGNGIEGALSALLPVPGSCQM
jgi:hypothetical protein